MAPHLLIDTDVHESLQTGADLLPYLEPYWRRFRPTTLAPASPYAMPLPTIGRLDWVADDGSMATDVSVMARHLFDEEGVSIAILNGLFHVSGVGVSYEYHQALARAYNDWQIENWLEKDERLRGSVHVVAHDPAVAAREIDRVAEHPQIVQVFLPAVIDRQYGDPMYRPIYEAAVRNGLVVALHHGASTMPILGQPRYYVERHSLNAPQAAMGQLCSFLFNGTFDAYPELKVAFLECSVGWVPWAMWRFDQQYKECRAEVPWLKRLPSEHMRDNVRFSTQPLSDMTAREFQQIVELGDAERMFMFSTDYPHFDADSPDTVLPSTLPDELRQRIRYLNALETYPRLAGLSAPQVEDSPSTAPVPPG
jgi:predicted TIM-barrel fold metal-dependent hydrolase